MKTTEFKISYKEVTEANFYTLEVYVNGDYFCQLSRRGYDFFWLWFENRYIENIILAQNIEEAKIKADKAIRGMIRLITPFVAEKVYVKRKWWHF